MQKNGSEEQQILKIDETSLYFKMLLFKTLVPKNEASIKSKHRETVLLWSSITENHKLSLMLI